MSYYVPQLHRHKVVYQHSWYDIRIKFYAHMQYLCSQLVFLFTLRCLDEVTVVSVPESFLSLNRYNGTLLGVSTNFCG